MVQTNKSSILVFCNPTNATDEALSCGYAEQVDALPINADGSSSDASARHRRALRKSCPGS